MRAQWCREHIDEVQENCDIGRTTVSDVKQAAKFCSFHVEFSTTSTSAIMLLLRIRDELVKERAISLAENALKTETPTVHPCDVTYRGIKPVYENSILV